MNFTLIAIYEGSQAACKQLKNAIKKIEEELNLPLKIYLLPSDTEFTAKFIDSSESYAFISSQHDIQKVHFQNIYFAETDGHQMILHCTEGPVIYNGSMKKLEQLFADQSFFRCNNSYLVNIHHIEHIISEANRYAIILSSGDKIPLSRTKRKTLLQKLSIR